MIDLSKIVLRRLLARLAFLAIGLLLIYYYVNHLFISQLSNPVLVYPDLDNTYWLFLFLAIPQQIAGSISLSILIDSSLVVFLVLSFVFWKKHQFKSILSDNPLKIKIVSRAAPIGSINTIIYLV